MGSGDPHTAQRKPPPTFVRGVIVAPSIDPTAEPPTVVVSEIEPMGTGLWRVRCQLPDGAMAAVIVPQTIVTLQSVRVAAHVAALLLSAPALQRPARGIPNL